MQEDFQRLHWNVGLQRQEEAPLDKLPQAHARQQDNQGNLCTAASFNDNCLQLAAQGSFLVREHSDRKDTTIADDPNTPHILHTNYVFFTNGLPAGSTLVANTAQFPVQCSNFTDYLQEVDVKDSGVVNTNSKSLEFGGAIPLSNGEWVKQESGITQYFSTLSEFYDYLRENYGVKIESK